jgi:hypothetical protein
MNIHINMLAWSDPGPAATLAGSRVYDGDRLAGVIDEELFSCEVFLPEGDIEFFHPVAIEEAELAVLIPLGVILSVLVPQQLEGDRLPLQLPEKIIHGGHGALGGRIRTE